MKSLPPSSPGSASVQHLSFPFLVSTTLVFTIHYTWSLQTLLKRKQVVQEVGNSVQRFLSTAPCFLLFPCSGMGCHWATVPSEVSLPQHRSPKGCSTEHLLPGCISIHVPNNVCFHTSPSLLLLFLQTLIFTYILMCSLLSVLPCLLSCISLHLLSPATATLPQTCLKRSAVCSPVWLKFWGVMDYFPPFRDTWNLLWPAQNSS